MATWAIVPVKPFHTAKSRLAGVLSPMERAALSREFLAHALDVLGEVPEVTHRLVVSRDPAALALARPRGAHTITESGAPDLNQALQRATQAARASRAEAVLVLPTDLPWLAVSDVRAMLANDPDGPSAVIAPDRHESGTNALWMRPPGLLPFSFGPGSFRRHLALAASAGIRARICRLPGLSLDVDVPEDLALYRAGQWVE
jgi:2-phospho-L-lactate guanylyltransferase